jgi:hypothetical protein
MPHTRKLGLECRPQELKLDIIQCLKDVSWHDGLLVRRLRVLICSADVGLEILSSPVYYPTGNAH